jgi:hypothetical protein
VDDALVTSVVSAIPQLGGAGLLVMLVVLLLRREGAELARERAAHDAEIAQRDKEVSELRLRLRELDEEVDRERALRRAAEDDAAGRHRARDVP